MANLTSRTKLTYADYLLFPEDGKRHELMDGEHYMTPAPNTRHQRISSNLHRMIAPHVHAGRLGLLLAAPTDVVLSDVDVVQPDLIFVTASRVPTIQEKAIHGAPDLLIEILSETTRKIDERLKRNLYERHGVSEYWLVDPEVETIKVYRLTQSRYICSSELAKKSNGILSTPLLPGLELRLSDIFE